MVHPLVRSGFADNAAAYDEARPPWPGALVAEVIGALGLRGAALLDVGAGTGKLTELLVPLAGSVTAVEPMAEMRQRLAAKLPGVDVRSGVAEQLPVASGSVDAVFAAAAFHWFDAAPALEEMHRVLRDDGALVLLWQRLQPRRGEPWLAGVLNLVEPLQKADYPARRHWSGDWRRAVEASGLFGPITGRREEAEQRLDLDELVAQVASWSFVASLPESRRRATLRQAAGLARQAAERGPLRLPYLVEAYWARRR